MSSKSSHTHFAVFILFYSWLMFFFSFLLDFRGLFAYIHVFKQLIMSPFKGFIATYYIRKK